MEVCAVFGHRKIDNEDKSSGLLNVRTTHYFDNLISEGCHKFLFGSNSEFNDLCYNIISDFKTKYTNICRIGYLCAQEIAFTTEESDRYLKYIENLNKKGRNVKIYDEIRQFDFENRNLYIERNKKMIDDADICVFYYNSKCLLPHNDKGHLTRSGTEIALEYAKSKNKKIIIINLNNDQKH